IQSFNYELPFGPGKKWGQKGGVVGQFVGGWQVNGILTARDGFPAYTSPAVDLSGSFATLLYADRLCDPNLPKGQRTLQRWFNTDCLAIPQPYHYGNAGYFPIRGPGMFNLDLSGFKRFRLAESKQLEFRVESFNFSNTPGFREPDTTIGAATAGNITALFNPDRRQEAATHPQMSSFEDSAILISHGDTGLLTLRRDGFDYSSVLNSKAAKPGETFGSGVGSLLTAPFRVSAGTSCGLHECGRLRWWKSPSGTSQSRKVYQFRDIRRMNFI